MKATVIEIPRSGKLPGSDTLSVCGHLGRPVIFKTSEFPPGSKVVYIPPWTVVDRKYTDFAWLASDLVRTKRFFGKPSFGLFVPAPEGCSVGEEIEVPAEPFDVTVEPAALVPEPMTWWQWLLNRLLGFYPRKFRVRRFDSV